MKRVLRWTVIAGVVLLAGVAVGALTQPHWDGPLSRIPGGALRGHVTPLPDGGWRFADLPLTLELEVDPSDPHSVEVAVLALDGRLYVPATLQPERKRWSRTLLREPTARLRIDGALHAVRARRVDDPRTRERLLELAVQKYRPSYFAPETTWFFELRPAVA